MQIVLEIHDATKEKPPTSKQVLVEGGCAYWDGENWRTLMESVNYTNFPVISWEVKWWADMPRLQ